MACVLFVLESGKKSAAAIVFFSGKFLVGYHDDEQT